MDCSRIFSYIDENFDSMVKEVQEICRFRSVQGDSAGLDGARSYIAGRLEKIGFSPRTFGAEEGDPPLVIAHRQGLAEETLLFYNHYDVVQEGDFGHWITGDPFAAQVRDGIMYARGVSDNKGPLMSRIHAVEAVLAVTGQLPVGVKFLVDGQEEIASIAMERFSRDHAEAFREMIRADACLWENGRKGLDGHPWARFGVRGGCAFDLSVTTAATDVHGRMGSAVPSAAWRLLWALASLKDQTERVLIEGFYDRVVPPTPYDKKILEMFPYDEEAQREAMGLPAYLAGCTGEALKQKIYFEPVVSVCGMEAGEMHKGVRGIVPHTASAHISFYLVPDQDPDDIARLLRRHLDRHGFEDVVLKMEAGKSKPIKTPMDIPFRRRLEESAAMVYDKPLVIEPTMLGSGPGYILRRVWPDLPIIGAGPGNNKANHHAPNENMILEDYRQAVKHIAALLCSYARR